MSFYWSVNKIHFVSTYSNLTWHGLKICWVLGRVLLKLWFYSHVEFLFYFFRFFTQFFQWLLWFICDQFNTDSAKRCMLYHIGSRTHCKEAWYQEKWSPWQWSKWSCCTRSSGGNTCDSRNKKRLCPMLELILKH